MASLSRRLAAEALGTALLLAIVIGSGIMGERLAGSPAQQSSIRKPSRSRMAS